MREARDGQFRNGAQAGRNPPSPFMLSTATRSGVPRLLPATMGAIEARRATEAAAKASPAEWAPSV